MAGWATFSRTTDTISVNANTQLGSAFTIEAVIRPRELQHGTMGGGMVWNEWQQNAEDKHVVLTPARGLRTFFYPNGGFPSGGSAAADSWHHYACVHDGTEARVYVDGQLVSVRPHGNPYNASSSIMHVGGIFRDGALQSSFIGDLDSLRISSVARYTGNAFVPTIGDMVADAATVLLYNFNEAPGTTVLVDESSSRFRGVLGTGFSGATSPTLCDVFEIGTQPVDQTVGVGNPVTFFVEVNSPASCPTPVSFQWQRRNLIVADPDAAGAWIDLSDGNGFLGTQAPNLLISQPLPGLATGYRCRIGGGCGCGLSAGFIYTDTVNFGVSCPADFNADGGIDFGDVEAFFQRWENGC
jgi:hypothetical protein